MKIDYQVLAQETLVLLRGRLSQGQLNRKIKAKTNQIARWESGHSKISWSDFCHLCEELKIPLKAHTQKFLFYEGDIYEVKNLLSFLSHFATYKEISKKMNISLSKVSRVMNNKSPVTLDFVYNLVDVGSTSLIDFVSKITAPDVPASLAKQFELLKKEKELHYKEPWIAAMLLFMRVYEDNGGGEDVISFLAKRLDKKLEEIIEMIERLNEFGLIEKTERGYISKNLHISTVGTFEGGKAIRQYWFQKCLDRINQSKPGQNHLTGYKIFTVNKKNKDQFYDFYMRVYAELDELIKNQGEHSDEVSLFTCQIINLDETSVK